MTADRIPTPPASDPSTPRHAPLLVDAKEACRLLSIGRRLLWSMTVSGQIPVTRIAKRTLYSVESLRAWIAQREEGGHQK